MELIVLKQASRELKEAPTELREDIFGLFEDLMAGNRLSSKMVNIGYFT
jgi:hypothetical protein